MVVNHIVKTSVHAIINVEGLSVSVAAFATVNLSSYRRRSANEVAAWLSNVPELSCLIIKLLFKAANSRSDCLCNFRESWRVFAIASNVVTREATSDINHAHFGHF